MTRQYTQRARAEQSAATRMRILAATRALLPAADQFQVEEIARRAGVSVPTLYTHFGSKGGLLSALTAEISREAGLFAGFERVWLCADGESALRTMLGTTLNFWHEAWTFIQFALRVRRTDAELGQRFEGIDASRYGHLVVICRRLHDEQRLRAGLSPARAARLAFAMTTPYVYEALVIQGGMPPRPAVAMAVEAASGAVLRPGTNPALSTPADWSRYGLKPPSM